MTITFNAQDGILVRTDNNKLNNGIIEDVICTFTFIDDYDEPELLIEYGFDYEYLEIVNGSCTLPQDVFECPTLTLQLISDDKESLPCVVAITNIKSPKYIVPKGSIEITRNGSYDVTDKKIANVNVADTPTPSQEKSVTIKSNTTTNVTPDDGKLLSKVTVVTEVPNLTLTGDAVVENVLKGKTFYAADYVKKTGTIETYSGATTITSNQTLNLAGKYCDKNVVIDVPNPVLDGTAKAADVLKGKTFYNTNYTKVVGTIETYSGLSTITSNGTLETAGMYLDKNLIINVPNPTLSGNAIASQVLKGQKFYSNSYTLQTGTMESYNGDFTITQNGTIQIAHMYVNSNIVVAVPSVIEVSTSAEMDALLVEANVGKYYKFVGTTDSKYTNGDIYQVESETPSSDSGGAIS